MKVDFHSPSDDLCRVVNRVQVALFTLDAEGRLAGWNDGAQRLTGFAAEEVLGEAATILDADQPKLSLTGLWQQLRSGEEFAEGRIALRHREGHVIDVLADLRSLEQDGTLVGAAGAMTNLTMHMQVNRRHSVVRQPERVRRAFQRMVGESPAMQDVFERIELAAGVDVTVLIRGETGSGKELAAQAIHALSERKTKPLVCVNCSAIPDPLLESELFGHVKGAFTGAVRDKRGVFEAAHGGQLFLDEIGDLGPSVQVKLLRALQEREIRRVGDEKTIKIDVRVVSATHRDLAAMVAAGQFREDLYYRLRVFELVMPPLRERLGDVACLIDHFVEEFSERHRKPVERLSPQALACAEAYRWPGNVRELRNAVEHAFVTVREGQIETSDLPREVQQAHDAPPAPPGTIVSSAAPPIAMPAVTAPAGASREEKEALEHTRIVSALHQAGGKKAVAASLLGMSRVTLWKKMKKLGISPIYGQNPLPPA